MAVFSHVPLQPKGKAAPSLHGSIHGLQRPPGSDDLPQLDEEQQHGPQRMSGDTDHQRKLLRCVAEEICAAFPKEAGRACQLALGSSHAAGRMQSTHGHEGCGMVGRLCGQKTKGCKQKQEGATTNEPSTRSWRILPNSLRGKGASFRPATCAAHDAKTFYSRENVIPAKTI